MHNSRPKTPVKPENEHHLPINPRRKFRRRGTGDRSNHPDSESEDEDKSIMTDSSDHELDDFGSDDDVESGLPTEERRKFLRKQRKQNNLDSRIAGVPGRLSEQEKKEADKSVMQKLVQNAILICLWYFFSLSISLYNKWMFSSDNLNFHFPLFTTSLHMVVQFLLASTVLLIFPSLRPEIKRPDPRERNGEPAKPLLTPLFYLTRLVPCGTTTSLDIGLGNASLQTITLTFYTMCKSSVLIFVLIFAFLFRLESPTIKLTLIILCMTLGVVMMVFGETDFHLSGFLLAISASFFSGFRWALTQILLLRHPATSNPFATMFFLAPIMFVTLFVIALFSEGPSAVLVGLQLLAHNLGVAKAVVLMFVPGVLAFCMIASEFTLLQRTNVVTLSICGIFKEVVTISAAGIVFHDELSIINVSGLLVTIVSIACYNYMKITKMRSDAREKLIRKEDQPNGAAIGGERYVEEPASEPLMGDAQEDTARRRSGSAGAFRAR
ncbi:hypothetical protein OHC33_002316 [Knufia fluminis]|uniref:Sugar phosphate transporter domain-containing protein n=1 Tax=Knufia fluminis TaxID=191047 RepID=A0AAN8EQY5_9EURO|nr:hypothetical protein OHC33_002316 [Knufia fluminis]